MHAQHAAFHFFASPRYIRNRFGGAKAECTLPRRSLAGLRRRQCRAGSFRANLFFVGYYVWSKNHPDHSLGGASSITGSGSPIAGASLRALVLGDDLPFFSFGNCLAGQRLEEVHW